MMKRVAIGSLLALVLSVGGCSAETPKKEVECVWKSPDGEPLTS